MCHCRLSQKYVQHRVNTQNNASKVRVKEGMCSESCKILGCVYVVSKFVGCEPGNEGRV